MKTDFNDDAYKIYLKENEFEVQPFMNEDLNQPRYNVFEGGGEFLFSILKMI